MPAKHDFIPDPDRVCEQDFCGQHRYCIECKEVKGHINHPDKYYDYEEMLHAQDSEDG